MSLYGARAGRGVIGADLAGESLRIATAASRRFRVDGIVRFIQSDLHQPGLRNGAFDVVFSSVLLHYSLDPGRAFSCLPILVHPAHSITIILHPPSSRLPPLTRQPTPT